MGDLIIGLQGTEAGHRLALGLALAAALFHALFGALQKGRHDPFTARAAIDAGLFALSLGPALFLVPRPTGGEWAMLAGAAGIHTIYKIGMMLAYQRGAYTVVYPVVRGTGPLFTVIGASVIFGEHFTAGQWLGVLVLVAGIFGLALYNMRHLVLSRDSLGPALMFAVLTGMMTAVYTTYDAWAIRATADPFTFLAWFFVLSSIDFPAWMALRRRPLPPDRAALVLRGLGGGLLAWCSFGSIMLATRLDKVGEAAVLRETSILFAAAIGVLFLGERVGPRRIALMALIAAGAVMVEALG